MWVNVFADAGALRRHTASVPDGLAGNGSIHAAPGYDAWNTYVTGFIQRQYSRKASSSLGLSGTFRSRLPLPARIGTSISSLSMSAAFSCTALPQRMPVEYRVIRIVRYNTLGAASIMRVTSSWLRTVGSRRGTLGNGMCSSM